MSDDYRDLVEQIPDDVRDVWRKWQADVLRAQDENMRFIRRAAAVIEVFVADAEGAEREWALGEAAELLEEWRAFLAR